MSGTASSSKMFYFHQPTVTRSPSSASSSSASSTLSSSPPSSTSSRTPSSWSPSLSSITTEESYFNNTKRSPAEKAALFLPAPPCTSTCRCTRCCLGDFVFDSEDDYRDYMEVIAQAQEAGTRLDQSATRTSALLAAGIATPIARSISCPPKAPSNA